jgi:heme-degrading monooxygenase HmoA
MSGEDATFSRRKWRLEGVRLAERAQFGWGETMIGRLWHGWISEWHADHYQQLVKNEVFPAIEARSQGFRGVFVLRRNDGGYVEFVTLTLWDSIAAVKSLVGEDYEVAYVPEEVQKLLDHFDQRALHYDLVMLNTSPG